MQHYRIGEEVSMSGVGKQGPGGTASRECQLRRSGHVDNEEFDNLINTGIHTGCTISSQYEIEDKLLKLMGIRVLVNGRASWLVGWDGAVSPGKYGLRLGAWPPPSPRWRRIVATGSGAAGESAGFRGVDRESAGGFMGAWPGSAGDNTKLGVDGGVGRSAGQADGGTGCRSGNAFQAMQRGGMHRIASTQ